MELTVSVEEVVLVVAIGVAQVLGLVMEAMESSSSDIQIPSLLHILEEQQVFQLSAVILLPLSIFLDQYHSNWENYYG
jgi:hypothetical protein